MQKKTSPETTQPLLSIGKNVREYVSIVQAVVTAFVAIVAIVVSVRTQPIVDSIRTLEFRIEAVESRDSNIESLLEKRDADYRANVNKIMEDLNIIKGEIRRIK